MVESALAWVSFHETLLGYLGATSLLSFVFTLLLVGVVIVRMPADYFAQPRDGIRRYLEGSHPVVRMAALTAKNAAGVLFILAGLTMLALPGQGILTILIGLTLVDFPGKRSLESRLVRQKRVLSSINRLRARAGKPPLRFP